MPASHERPVRAELLDRGGPELWDRFMDELVEQLLGIPRSPGTPSVFRRNFGRLTTPRLRKTDDRVAR